MFAGLTATPLHLPQLCGDIKHLRWTLMQVIYIHIRTYIYIHIRTYTYIYIKHLRWTLMQVHGGADLDFMIHKVPFYVHA
jgi:hypothetical protein